MPEWATVLARAKVRVARPMSTTGNHGAPLLDPPSPPPPPPMTHAKMMAKLLAAHRELARALEIMAQAVTGFARGGHGGNGGNRGGARRPEGPSSY